MKSPAQGDHQPPPRRVIIGTAGHIDHGKTALVYALTGTDTDRLPEEKKRGITIDLGFADLRLRDSARGDMHLSLIDVPGHHAFVRNMLAGTGGIDCVMLVIAADEGVKAQTEEHLAICGLLGIERGLVVLTKVDAVSEAHLAETRARVERFLKGTFLEDAPVISVSALNGQGISELKTVIASLAAEIPPRATEKVPRLPLDRAFSVRGFGTVVTGTLQSGTIKAGDVFAQNPAGRLLRVRGLQVHGHTCQAADAPCRVAVNLPGVEVGQIGRGDTLIIPETLSSTRTVDVELTMLAGAPVLKHGSRSRVHAFTSETLAKVLFFDQKNTAEPGSGLARLRLAKPLLLVPGDRIVLRQCSPALTIGGACVLDATVPSGVRKSSALEWLKALRAADSSEQLRLRVARRGLDGIAVSALVSETGLTAEALRTRAESLLANGQLIECSATHTLGAHWISTDCLKQAVHSAQGEMERAGSLSRAELRFKTRLNSPVFAVVLSRMIASGKFEVSGEIVRLAGSGDNVPEPKRRQLQAIENMYAKAGLAAPLLSDVAKELRLAPEAMRELITLLLRSKRLVRMGTDDAFVHPRALDKLYGDLRIHRGEMFDVTRFKSFTGLTRKHAIPLLEHLDQARVTRNNGGTRIIL